MKKFAIARVLVSACRKPLAKKRLYLPAALAVVALIFAVPPAPAQTFRGAIVGTVIDQSLAPVPGAKVTVKNQATGLTRTTLTGDAGQYNVAELPIGTYTVTIEKQGFGPATQADVSVDVASERRVDVELVAATVKERVEVRAEVSQVATTEDTLGGTIVSNQVENLPVNGRDYTKLIYLNPGVSGSPDQITDSPGSFGEFSVNGARGRANNFLLDGTDMNDGYRNEPAINQPGVFGTPSTILPVDAVAELAVLSNFAPEYGRNAGAVINIVTKSGTNEFHGTAADYFRNSALDARNFFNTGFDSTTGGPPPKTSFHNNQYGASLGGPIVKNKTFFFADWEGQREIGGLNNTACVPSPDMITAASQGITINPVIAKLLQRNPWPAPNLSPLDSCPNVSTTVPIFNYVNSVIGKIDHTFNEKNLLTGRYYYGTSNQSFPLGLGNSGDLPGFNTVTPTDINLLSLSYVHTVSPTQVNEVRFGYNRFHENFLPQDSSFNPGSIGLDTGVGAQDYGLPNISVVSFASGPYAVGSFTSLGATHSVPRGRTDANWQFIDNFSWKFGRHELKLGYEFRRTTVSQFFDETYRGTLSFSSLSYFLQGIPSGGSQVAGDSNRNTFQDSHAGYVQDSFRWSSNLTLNLGLRWDYYGVIGEENNLFSNYDPVNGLRLVNQLYQPDYNNFAPRFSVAYDLGGKGKTVIRTGWGTFYDAFSQDFFLGHVPYNSSPPGPAYNGIGPEPISSNGGVTSQIVAGEPIYLNFGPTTNIFAADQHLRTPYMFNYNLNIQQQVSSNIVFQVGYVGSEGHKLFRFRDINQRVTPTSPTLPNPNFGYINYEESSANSNYNSVQAQLRIRGFRGFESTVNYNYSHSIDNASDGEDFEPNASQPNNSWRPDLERSNSNFDIRHRFVWMANYALPKGRWQGAMGKLADGWGLDSVLTLQTGQPFQLNYNYSGDYDGTGEFFPRPDVVGNPYAGTSTPNDFINLTAFEVPCTFSAGACVAGTQHTGTEARNFLFGPPFKQWDFAVYKDTDLSERVKMQVRADFFNILNHPNFSNPFLPLFFAAADNNGIDPNTGRGIGFLPIAATGDVGIGNPFLGGGGPRGIQLAVKFNF
jgi:outer membrane receptor protein involved in Fe transport